MNQLNGTFKCSILNAWYDSIETARLEITSPSGKTLRIKKTSIRWIDHIALIQDLGSHRKERRYSVDLTVDQMKVIKDLAEGEPDAK